MINCAAAAHVPAADSGRWFLGDLHADRAPMLIGLWIRDVVLIEALDLVIGPGLTVLTGETGAGKSILLDALGLAVGGRGDAGLVRHGAGPAIATAIFAPPPDHAVWAILEEKGVAWGLGEDLV